ncbi:hypothetical protein [Actinoplanes xinjiangensis]|uniref:Uncharacterized protein n=1 Tax=Actinoplanes xinjiangensis TaxID=512350 RepID=A0A316F6I1_9ACTN|nr:hypothetical protein [Actinoplanes xinjiangensis]PWK39529.1 hypothetical protein BC793_122101 [Actinoplanes xinjiangensis]GIF42608.1 hypothetical protein Axi01nite_69190 [Actinoplanes xinjiangensis]
MRTRDSIAMVAAALSIAASFVIVNLPLPVTAPGGADRSTQVIVVTEAGPWWDCPDEAADG